MATFQPQTSPLTPATTATMATTAAGDVGATTTAPASSGQSSSNPPPVTVGIDGGWNSVSWSQWIGTPIAELFTGTADSGARGFLWVAVGHAVVAVAWMLIGLQLDQPGAARTARIGGPLLLGWAILEFNAMVNPIGAAVALLLVIGFLIVGIALEDGILISLGALAGMVTGLRTIWSLFTGEVAVTITIAAAGVLMLAIAMHECMLPGSAATTTSSHNDGRAHTLTTEPP